MIMDKMREIGLYNAVTEIRCGVLVSDLNGDEYSDNELVDPKLKIVYIGTYDEYERPTLLHMRGAIETDPVNTKYFYCHTKGIRWFGTEHEPFVVDWIKLLIYWNIEMWTNAADVLNKYDTYGCNYHSGEKWSAHYSGNFFWTTLNHLKTLPDTIGPEYNDTEFWVCSAGNFNGRPNVYNAFGSNLDHYCMLCPESLYRK